MLHPKWFSARAVENWHHHSLPATLENFAAARFLVNHLLLFSYSTRNMHAACSLRNLPAIPCGPGSLFSLRYPPIGRPMYVYLYTIGAQRIGNWFSRCLARYKTARLALIKFIAARNIRVVMILPRRAICIYVEYPVLHFDASSNCRLIGRLLCRL